MIIIKLNGGLGNQLQQYALYEKLKSLGKEVRLDISWFRKQQTEATKRELELQYFPNPPFSLIIIIFFSVILFPEYLHSHMILICHN